MRVEQCKHQELRYVVGHGLFCKVCGSFVSYDRDVLEELRGDSSRVNKSDRVPSATSQGKRK